MKNLKLIQESFSHFENIANSKNSPYRETLNKLKEDIRKHYIDYNRRALNNKWHRFHSAGYNGMKESALLLCYNSKCQALDVLKAEIREAQDDIGKEYCQYCTVNKSETFDHYLSQHKHCEYSVLSFNLIPCCYSCNNKKREQLLSPQGRLFINLYYDTITNYKYLYCFIIYKNHVPFIEYKIKRNSKIPDEDFIVIKNHYDKLELLELFKNSSNNIISDIKLSLETFAKGKSLNKIKDDLLSMAKQLKVGYGKNYWKAILHEALTKSDDFLNSLDI